MKKISIVFLAVALLGTLTSCHNKQKSRDEKIAEFRSELTTEDTTAMLKLADEAMEQLKAKKIDQVLATLFEYNDSTEEVKPLEETTAKRYERKFKMFPVLDYRRVYYSFMLEGCNDVEYEVTFATAEQAGTKEPPTTKFMFNPVKVDGTWMLCVKTPLDETAPERR